MPKLTKSQTTHYKEVFQMFDRDRSGAITTADLSKLFESLGKTVKEDHIKAVINDIDACGTGIITYNEFC